MTRVLLHPLAGVLSAYGMGLADVRALKQQAQEAILSDADAGGRRDHARHARSGGARGRRGAGHRRRARSRRSARCTSSMKAPTRPSRPAPGTSRAIVVEFERKYRQQYGFLMPGKPLVVEAVAVEAIGRTHDVKDAVPAFAPRAGPPAPIRTNRIYTDGAFRDAVVHDRLRLRPGDAIAGPAVIREDNATTVVEPGWRATFTERGDLVLERIEAARRAHAIGTTADPIMLEVFNNLFMAIAEQMGVTLANTAYSVNIKERLDFSCALFDGEGNLVANAPHMPVHLGSMGESVKTIIERRGGAMRAGRRLRAERPVQRRHASARRHCDHAGVPRRDERDSRAPEFYVASRGHHADIGGITPGSMPPDRRTSTRKACCSTTCSSSPPAGSWKTRCAPSSRSGRYPSRNVDQNLADLRAQVAACAKGAQELAKMVAHFGLPVVRAYMRHVQDNAEESVRRVLDVLKDGHFEYEMDSGATIAVTISIDKAKRRATVDFTGTSAQQPTNFNAPSAVCKAAVLYVFRTLVDDDIPMNAGCLKPLDIVIPEGSMLAPRYPAAVVAGNVETSQAITDTLYGALGVLAASQGTMNNFTFGNARLSVLRDDLGRLRRRAGFRRRERRADAHDQLAAHRSRRCWSGASRCGSSRSRSAGAAAARAGIAAATAACGGSASSSR